MRSRGLSRCAGFIFPAVWWCCLSHPVALAGQTSGGPTHFTIYVDNDSWSNTGTDEHYTHGTKLEWGRVGWSAGLGRRVFRDQEPCRSAEVFDGCYLERTDVALGQNMYTPRDLTRSDRIIGDRPYGGWLYLEARTEAATPSAANLGLDAGRQWGVGASIGVVGPASLADTTQRWWHESVVGAQRPNGWSHQIANRPAFMLMGDVKQRLVDLDSRGLRYFDAIGEAGTALGNVLTAAHLGGTLRAGYNVGNDFGANYITPSPPPPPLPSASPGNDGAMRTDPLAAASPRRDENGSIFTAYAFVAAEGRAVLYNVFLDAEADRYAIRRRPWVSDLSWGGVVRVCYFTFSYRRVNRSREFNPSDVSHHYDAMSLTFGPRCRG